MKSMSGLERKIVQYVRKKKTQLAWIFVFCAILVFVGLQVNVRERVMFAVSPSAELAFRIGQRHFNAKAPLEYDVERAREYFLKAYALDKDYPFLNHELARIEFLYGRYPDALIYINREIELHPVDEPNVYYVRALIYGYQGRYLEAALDYEKYFTLAPANWAGINDYSWVLLKAGMSERALHALEWGLGEWPDNAWLLNNYATALYELKRFSEAKSVAERAKESIQNLKAEDWLIAYPGNDPLVAEAGLESFRAAAAENMAKIADAVK